MRHQRLTGSVMKRISRHMLMAVLAVAVAPVCAADVVLSPPGADGWEPLTFSKIKNHTVYTAAQSGSVHAESHCAASALYLPLTNIDLSQTPRLHWRWKVADALHVPDERVKAGDDFAARVYVMFRFDAAHASVIERMWHGVETKLYGREVPGTAIDYVWSSAQPLGSEWDSPYTADVKMVSLGHGPLPEWTDETVDLVADYQAYFGSAPPPLAGIGLMTDTDNTCAHAAADYADFRFIDAVRRHTSGRAGVFARAERAGEDLSRLGGTTLAAVPDLGEP